MKAVGGLLLGAERETDGWTSAVAALLAALSLGRALQINNGHFRPEAIAMLTLACALALVAVVSPRFSAIERHFSESAGSVSACRCYSWATSCSACG